MLKVSVLFSEPKIPQSSGWSEIADDDIRFSALQRAENSSIIPRRAQPVAQGRVSVLFSEPKIPQSVRLTGMTCLSTRVSVLFSEPKIPQFIGGCMVTVISYGFQCSSASRKFLNITSTSLLVSQRQSFSALQRAENSSMSRSCRPRTTTGRRFSALQRAENSSIC